MLTEKELENILVPGYWVVFREKLGSKETHSAEIGRVSCLTDRVCVDFTSVGWGTFHMAFDLRYFFGYEVVRRNNHDFMAVFTSDPTNNPNAKAVWIRDNE